LVESRAGDAPRAEGLDQRRLVDHRPPSDVDQERGRLHQGQLRGPDEPAGVAGERDGDHHDVGLAQQVGLRAPPREAIDGPAGRA